MQAPCPSHLLAASAHVNLADFVLPVLSSSRELVGPRPAHGVHTGTGYTMRRGTTVLVTVVVVVGGGSWDSQTLAGWGPPLPG